MDAIIEAFFICLLASMIWAPVVFFIVARFAHKDGQGVADKLWPSALVVAALPALCAPFAAAFGLSLRNPAPLPPMGAMETPANYMPVIPAETIAAPAATFNLTAMLEAAAVLYFYGFLMFLALGAIRMIWFSYRVRYAFEIDEPKLEAGLEAWRARMGIRRRPRYAFSDAVSSVCVHGFFRPVILMPMSLLDRVPLEDAVLMGAHEMAHIRRGDTWLFALCTAVKAIFWFNPFMQHIAARANLAAEQAADALVIARGAERRQYAHCFVQGLRFAAGASPLGRELVPSFTPFDKRSRRERLDAILSKTGAAPMLGLPHKIGLAISIILAAGLAFAQAALAVAPQPAKDALPETPVEGDVTLPFGKKASNLNGDSPTHQGVDIRADRGTVVRAAGDGKIINATDRYHNEPAWGKVVVIDHGHGLVTRYAHLDSYLVHKGDRVDAGDAIGAVGSTGKVTGPHLHFEVIRDGLPIDPAPVLAAAPMPAPEPAPAAKPVIKTKRAVMIAPAPAVVPDAVLAPSLAPVADPVIEADPGLTADPASPAPPAATAEMLDERLAGRFEIFGKAFGEEFRERYGKEFSERFGEEYKEAFENLDFEFAGMDFSDFDFEGLDEMPVIVMNRFEDLRGLEMLSDEEREEFERKANLAAKKDLERAKRDRERAERDRKRADRDRERALRDAERERSERQREREEARAERQQELAEARAEREQELAEARAEREQERAEREYERAMEQAEAQIEQELERAERERERMERDGYKLNEHDALDLREKALREAQADLEQEIKKIERDRAKLERKRKQNGNKDD